MRLLEIKMKDCRSLYLDLMKKSLTNWIYGDNEQAPIMHKGFFMKMIVKTFESRGIKLVRDVLFDKNLREKGLDWPPTAHTMIGIHRLDNLQFCVEEVLVNNIPGDLIETGVWRGGSTIFMRAILKAYGVIGRRVWVADSFEGLPVPNPNRYPEDAGDIHHTFKELKVTLDEVKRNFERYDLLDEQVCFLKGWFKDILPNAPIDRLAVIRLDGDMYGSTMDVLVNLYPKVSIGGYVIVDDYCLPSCKRAVHDYREQHKIQDAIQPIDGIGVYWQRSM